MRLNKACIYPDLSNLFLKDDVTDRAQKESKMVEVNIEAFQKRLDGALPEAAIGEYCTSPYNCPLFLGADLNFLDITS
jgi:hypothetical protein